MVLYPWSHFLPVNRRESRSNLFSIFKRWISYWHSSIVVYPFPLGRPLRFRGSPAPKRACSRLYRLIQFLICTFPILTHLLSPAVSVPPFAFL